MGEPLRSLAAYSQFVAEAVNRPTMTRSTIAVWSESSYTGTAEGEIWFSNGVRLRIRQEIDFHAGLITSYGYEAYRAHERLYWYDDFPHPEDPALSSTYPHHKHVPPDLKHHRIPAPAISFARPNLTHLIEEVEQLSPI